MGLFDDLFGGLFDLDGDGKLSWDEDYLAYQAFKDATEDDDDDDGKDDWDDDF